MEIRSADLSHTSPVSINYSNLDLVIRFKSDYVVNFNTLFNLDIKNSAWLEVHRNLFNIFSNSAQREIPSSIVLSTQR
jgi:hypothetical protein